MNVGLMSRQCRRCVGSRGPARAARWSGVVSPDGHKEDHEEREDHLHVGQRIHPERTQDDQLDHLQPREEVDLPLRHPADVVGGRIRRLDGAVRKMIRLIFLL